MDVQVFKTNLLNKVSKLTNNKYDRENVTSYIYKNPNRFRVFEISSPPNLYWPELGLTLDTKDDFKLIKKIILRLEKIKPFFSCLDIIDFLKNLKITKINKNVVRKENYQVLNGYQTLIIGLGKIGMLYDYNNNLIVTHSKSVTNNKNFKLISAIDPNHKKRTIFQKNIKKKHLKILKNISHRSI